MTTEPRHDKSGSDRPTRKRDKQRKQRRSRLRRRLAAYTAAGAATVATAPDADGKIVYTPGPLNVGINESLNIDFNMDSTSDFLIEHFSGLHYTFSSESGQIFPITYQETDLYIYTRPGVRNAAYRKVPA